jgi:hypothetical protein
MLEPAVLATVAGEVRNLVNRHGGGITLSYATDLYLAQRAP